MVVTMEDWKMAWNRFRKDQIPAQSCATASQFVAEAAMYDMAARGEGHRGKIQDARILDISMRDCIFFADNKSSPLEHC